MQKKIVIGTRGSELALVQAGIVSKALKSIDPAVEIEIEKIVTRGDIDQRAIPADVIGKGWFTKEIEEALLAERIDMAVHSLKDVGEAMLEGLTLAAYLPREDARDALVTKDGQPLEKLKHGAVVGTDSPRRQAQMLALRPDLNMKSLRGNVPTRLAKLDGTFKGNDGKPAGSYDAIVLAVAGLKRLGLEQRIARIFEPSEMTPAPGQGILAIQIRDGDKGILEILKKANDTDADRAARLERGFARATGAGCKSPTGAYAFRDGDEWVLVGVIADEDGSNVVRGERRTAAFDEGMAQSLAKELSAKLK